MTDENWAEFQAKNPEEAPEVVKALSRLPESDLPPLLRCVKGLNLFMAGQPEEGNRVLSTLYSNNPEDLKYWSPLNAFHVERKAASGRPRILTNALGGRVGLGLMANADCVFFTRGDRLEKRGKTVITYRLETDTFADILKLLPEGWEPDYVFFFLTEVFSLPLGIENSPYPVVNLPGDPWRSNKLVEDMRFFDATVPAISPMCAAFEKFGKVLYTSCAGVQGNVPLGIEGADRQVRDYDVVFTGSVSSPFYRKRAQYLWRLLRLQDRYKIFVGFFENIYDVYRMMARSKIVVHCASRQGGVNLRPFEVACCGALLLHEEGDRSIEEFFTPGEEVALFDESNFEERIEYYLSHHEERQKIVERAMKRNAEEAHIRLHMQRVVDLIRTSSIAPNLRTAQTLPADVRWNSLGVSDFYAQNYNRAAQCFDRALELAPGAGKYANNLAVTLMMDSMARGEVDTRIEPLLQAANRNATPLSRFNTVCYYWSVAPNMHKLLDEARKFLHGLGAEGGYAFTGDEIPFSEEPKHYRFDESWIFRMEMEFSLFDHAGRRADYQERILRTLHWRTLEYTADAYMALGQHAAAARAYELALGLFSENELILAKLGRAYMAMSLLDRAEERLTQALELSPFFESVHLDLCRVQAALGHIEEIRARLSHLLRYQALKTRDQFESILGVLPGGASK